MKKVLILPSSTGQGDLSVAATLATALHHEFDVATAYFEQNRHSPLLLALPGDTILFGKGAHPNYPTDYESQLREMASEITTHAPDVVIALNESLFPLAAYLAGRPVIQVTHLLDPGLVSSGRWMLKKARQRCASLPSSFKEFAQAFRNDDATLIDLLKELRSLQRPSRLVRAIRKIRRTASPLRHSRLKMELVSRYGYEMGASYLSQVISDELIGHSIFAPQKEAVKRINLDRSAFGNSPLILASSVTVVSRQHQAEQPVPVDQKPKTILLTFGGIDHAITPGMERLMRILNAASRGFKPCELQIVIAGRVTETKRSFFEEAMETNSLFQSGGIKLIGSIHHHEHLAFMETADLVMTQPGYSTLCELVTAQKPFVLFYGLAPYYEQFVNFSAAGNTGMNHSERSCLQIGEYGQFGSRRTALEKNLTSNLKKTFSDLVRRNFRNDNSLPQTPYPHFTAQVAERARRLMQTRRTEVQMVI